jgi:hypothetical protein
MTARPYMNGVKHRYGPFTTGGDQQKLYPGAKNKKAPEGAFCQLDGLTAHATVLARALCSFL